MARGHLDEGMDTELDSTLFSGRFLAAPVLMTLAIEIALKALQYQERRDDYDREHDLLKWFQNLNEDTRARLKVRLPSILDAVSLRLGVQNYCPVGAGIEKVLEYHQRTFIDWRYSYEKVSGNTCYLPELNKVLTVIIETYEERVAAENNEIVTENNDSQSN